MCVCVCEKACVCVCVSMAPTLALCHKLLMDRDLDFNLLSQTRICFHVQFNTKHSSGQINAIHEDSIL